MKQLMIKFLFFLPFATGFAQDGQLPAFSGAEGWGMQWCINLVDNYTYLEKYLASLCPEIQTFY